MKIVHNCFNDLIKFSNLFQAWREFRLGKTCKENIQAFEHNLEDNLFNLNNDLANLTYQHGLYHRFIICDPKQRVIHKAQVRDRIVHTLAAKKLEELYQSSFISHSYACQKQRGTHKALKFLVKMCRRQSKNYTQNFWYLKCDIKKFFDNIDHEKLLHILSKKIKDQNFIWLIKNILSSFHYQIKGVGLPLGNFTSQWLGNIYLNELDYFVKHHLRIKKYIRYADDFVILDDNKNFLEENLEKIKDFLTTKLDLTVHPNKIIIKKFSSGLDWVGFKILPHYVILKKQTQKRMLKKLDKHYNDVLIHRSSLNQYYQSLNSYLGQLKHCFGHKLSNKILFNSLSYDHTGKIF